MRRGSLCGAFSVAAALGLVWIAGAAWGGATALVAVNHSRHLSGPYQHGNSFGIDSIHLNTGDTTNLFYKVTNTSSHRLHLSSETVAGESEPGFRIHWFTGHHNVTAAMTDGSTRVFYILGPGQPKIFRAHVHMATAQSECVDVHVFNQRPSLSQIGYSAYAIDNRTPASSYAPGVKQT